MRSATTVTIIAPLNSTETTTTVPRAAAVSACPPESSAAATEIASPASSAARLARTRVLTPVRRASCLVSVVIVGGRSGRGLTALLRGSSTARESYHKVCEGSASATGTLSSGSVSSRRGRCRTGRTKVSRSARAKPDDTAIQTGGPS